MEKTTLQEPTEGEGGSTETRPESPSPPPYSPREATGSPSPPAPNRAEEPPSNATIASPSDPALVTITSAFNNSTRTVNLSSRALSTLPALSTGSPPPETPAPTALDLSRNLLTRLPLVSIEAWNWSNSLRTLTITHNRLSSLSDPQTATSLPSLPLLTNLDLSHNHLISTSPSSQSLLAELHSLFPALRHLSLSYNRLISLEGIDALLLSPRSQLKTLALNGNKISDITALCRAAEKVGASESDGTWTLEELDLSDNEIARVSRLPSRSSVASMSSKLTFRLRLQLQPTLGLLPHSLILSVSGNTFRFPKREIWERPGARLLLPNLRERLG
jgi:hypothetical protein